MTIMTHPSIRTVAVSPGQILGARERSDGTYLYRITPKNQVLFSVARGRTALILAVAAWCQEQGVRRRAWAGAGAQKQEAT